MEVTPIDKIIDVVNMLASKSNWKVIEDETGVHRGVISVIKYKYPLFAGLPKKYTSRGSRSD